MKRIAICGHYHDGGKYNGQTIKTKMLTELLKKEYLDGYFEIVDTYSVHCNKIKFVYNCFIAFIRCDDILILPAQLSIKYLVPFFSILNIFFKKNIHYYVVGGWLQEYIEIRPWLIHFLKRYKGIYVEIKSMEEELTKNGFSNIYFVHKFRSIKLLNEDEVLLDLKIPYKICFYSRVMKEKGIEDVINAVKEVNKQEKKVIYALDIFGPIDVRYMDEFKRYEVDFPEYIKYKGIVDHEKVAETLKEYSLMIFPTHYSGEGYANVIVDAFSSGLPVVASNWKYNMEIINDGVDGYLYSLSDENGLQTILFKIMHNPNIIAEMKKNVRKRAEEFAPDRAITPLLKNLH